MRIFLDLDGVMADFDGYFRQLYGKYPWDYEDGDAFDVIISNTDQGKGYFRSLPLMPRAMDLWNEIKKYNPIILTATGHMIPSAAEEKIEWVRKHISETAEIIIETKGRDKYKHIRNPTDLLIDDRSKAIDPWVKSGAVGILYSEDRFDEIIDRIHLHMLSLYGTK